MSAERTLVAAITGLTLSLGVAAADEEEDYPDVAFLEYLGGWESSDEVWAMLDNDIRYAAAQPEPIVEPRKTNDDEEPADNEPEDDETTEQDDEA
jgi:hypothetical protein